MYLDNTQHYINPYLPKAELMPKNSTGFRSIETTEYSVYLKIQPEIYNRTYFDALTAKKKKSFKELTLQN